MAISYKDAGVDVAAGEALVDWLKQSESSVKASAASVPHKEKIVSGIGGFAALFRASFQGMKSPCLVSSTDGVGTKVKVAADFGRYEGVGQDLVAMCVNDLVCVGAEPLFFLDYYACSQLDLAAAKAFLSGVKKACHESGCALIGGETAEMPGVYQGKDFDCAGFAVGVVDEEAALGAHRVRPGDRLVGISSSGFHSNGYSLLRQVFASDMKDWSDVLLRPTHLYPSLVREVMKKLGPGLHAVAHITGGGMDNLLRVIPEGTALELSAWDIPEIFLEVKKRARMEWSELLRTLNCGIGMVMVVAQDQLDHVWPVAKAHGFESFDLGIVKNGEEKKWSLDFSKMKG